jgi:hypothetical protein
MLGLSVNELLQGFGLCELPFDMQIEGPLKQLRQITHSRIPILDVTPRHAARLADRGGVERGVWRSTNIH